MIETNVTVLNEISAKLGGKADATLVVEALNNIANAMGDNEPDKLKTVSEALEDILEYAGGGGGSSITPLVEITVINNSSTDVLLYDGIYIRDNKYYKEEPTVASGETKVITEVAKITDYGEIAEADAGLISAQ